MTGPEQDAHRPPLCRLHDEAPATVARLPDGAIVIDFGRVTFGNLSLRRPGPSPWPLTVHFGEDSVEGRVNRTPLPCVRYAAVPVAAAPTGGTVVVAPEADRKNTGPAAVRTPPEWGVVLPFRWVEIEGWPDDVPFDPETLRRRSAYEAGWSDAASDFTCSDPLLNRVWDLCRHTIKATTFAGVYVDGDRERIPYEADAYLNQLSHLCCNADPAMARATIDHLIQAPTWPVEWAAHLIFMVHADWMQTGDTAWLRDRYPALDAKLFTGRERADGLIVTPDEAIPHDIVDWPKGERDGFAFSPVNSVVNAFHYRALVLLAELAGALGRVEDATAYAARAARLRVSYVRAFLDEARGLFRDGEQVAHCSLHANLFALAFGLAPDACRSSIRDHLVARGMACSVYAAQYLLEALFETGADTAALALITAPGDRSWRHMIERGATLTWEAWDARYKPNLDWNHAWGAAPANLLPRTVAGIRPSAPGWRRAEIRPHPGALTACRARMPTPHGPVEVEWRRDADSFTVWIDAPLGMEIRLSAPVAAAREIEVNGTVSTASVIAGRTVIDLARSSSTRHQVRLLLT